MPDGRPGLLMQVIDTGPGLRGADYRTLFDPAGDFGKGTGQALPRCDKCKLEPS
jgi:hypothetical protein